MVLTCMKKVSFFYFCLVLVLIYILSISISCAKDNLPLYGEESQVVESINEESLEEPDENITDYDSSNFGGSSRIKKKEILESDSIFPVNKDITLNTLIMKVSLILFFLLIILFFIKLFLSRNRFDKPGSFLDELTQKITGGFSSFKNTNGLKLKQTLILTPGQNLYLVEIENKKLLLGGTHQGGVQFLVDLTENSSSNKLDFKEIEAFQNYFSSGGQISENTPNGMLKDSNKKEEIKQVEQHSSNVSELPFNLTNSTQVKQAIKRRTSFRQSLLNQTSNGSGELAALK